MMSDTPRPLLVGHSWIEHEEFRVTEYEVVGYTEGIHQGQRVYREIIEFETRLLLPPIVNSET